ncbi:MAG: nuclear transport factor 2 family protein [Gammaproteobacteria bacterium]|nr:nuclear transport factor 2 family protein [Gammaproteobacteria bacterium]
MSPEETARAFLGAVEQGNLELAFSYMAEEFRFHGPRIPPLTKTDYRNNLEAIVAAFDDWHYNPQAFHADDDGVLRTRIQVAGLQTGTLAFPGAPEIPASGKRYSRPEEPLGFEVVDGLIQAMHMNPSGDRAAIYDIVDEMDGD